MDEVAAATFEPFTCFGVRRDGDVEAMALGAAPCSHDGVGTMFVLALGAAEIETNGVTFPVPAPGYAVVPGRGSVRGGGGVAVVHRGHRGLFTIGGPVEPTGRLTYIDGCSDTVLVAPVVRGDPCLNLLHLPPRVVQTDHEHPSMRIGIVVSGAGVCVLQPEVEKALLPGTVFVLPEGTVHRFETSTSDLRLLAWHPDSDVGPTDDDHPMLNRTLHPGTSQRVR